MTDTTITIDAAALTRLVTITAPFVDGPLMERLNSIHLQTRDGRLHAEATNRYAIMRARTEPAKHPGGVNILVPAKPLVGAIKLFKPRRGTKLTLTCTVTDDTLTIAVDDGITNTGFTPSTTIPLRNEYLSSFPSMDGIMSEINDVPDQERASELGISPRLLRLLPDPQDSYTPALFLMGKPGRPMAVYTDEWFAIAMPMRRDPAAEEQIRGGWAA